MIEPDERGRVSLAKIPGENAERYIGRRLPNGSVILEPAVLVSQQALDSLATLQAAGRTHRLGRSVRETLDRYGRQPATEAQLAAAKAVMGMREMRGARSLADLVNDETRIAPNKP